MRHSASTGVPELPSLNAGLTLLASDERTGGALHSLVLDQTLVDQGRAVWVDAHGNGTTAPLAQLAPSPRVLERVDIARAFTPWQHHGLLRDLGEQIDEQTALVVLPEFDWFYRADDLQRTERERMRDAGIELVESITTDRDVPVLLTQSRSDDFTAPLRSVVDETIQCELTQFGPRFAGEEFETLVYALGEGMVQTTLSFWRRVLASRHPSITEPAASEVTTVGSN